MLKINKNDCIVIGAMIFSILLCYVLDAIF
jgi:hypothetical protein